MSAETLSTPRLRLRAPAPHDAPRMADLLSDLDVTRMLARVPYPYARQDAEAYISRCQTVEDAVFAVEQEGGLIGVIGFHAAKDGGAMGPEVGYWLGRPYWGKGFATEALGAALRWAGERWGKRCVVSSHFIDNPRSGAVLVKSGFLYTGEVIHRQSLARGEGVASRMMIWLA